MMAFSTLLKYLKVKIIHCNVNDRAGDASEGEPVNHDTQRSFSSVNNETARLRESVKQ